MKSTKLLWVTSSAKSRLGAIKIMFPPDFKIRIDSRDIPIGDINLSPVIPPDQLPLLDIDKTVRSEYTVKHNPNMG